ncbi:MAG TPA: hypothetical protein VFS76_21630 [Pyrinomonadaceae bacterium]|nr:hypothetical protein [Pyrinomonadaceae bacterium]
MLNFEKFKSLRQTKGGYVDVYEVRCGDQFFGFLYITSDRYSLVWRNVAGFKFDLPYSLIEFQFSQKPPWRIKELHPSFPFRKEKPEFYYQNASASVFLQGQENAREFDLLDQPALKKYRSEFLDQQPDSMSRIAFARYDSEISFKSELYKICFTAERLNQEANDDWEFVVNLPRAIVLNPFSLRWVVENHEARAAMEEGTDFKASRAALSDILSL